MPRVQLDSEGLPTALRIEPYWFTEGSSSYEIETNRAPFGNGSIINHRLEARKAHFNPPAVAALECSRTHGR